MAFGLLNQTETHCRQQTLEIGTTGYLNNIRGLVLWQELMVM